MKPINEQETAAFVRVMARLDYLQEQLDVAKQRIVELENLLTGAEIMSDKGYELTTHEKQAEFAKQRTYKDIGDCV